MSGDTRDHFIRWNVEFPMTYRREISPKSKFATEPAKVQGVLGSPEAMLSTT